MSINASDHWRVVPDASATGQHTPGLDGVPAVMSPLEASEVYARHADELAATAEHLAELNRQQGRTIAALSAAFGELHVVLDELVNALAGDPR